MNPTKSSDSDIKQKLKELYEYMDKNELVYDAKLENNNHNLCLIIDDIHKDLIEQEIRAEYTELMVLHTIHIVDTKYEMTVGYPDKL